MKKHLLLLVLLLYSALLPAQITINHQGPLKDLLSVLKNKYGYSFMYNNNDINDRQTITINLNNTNINTILEEISKTTKLKYVIINKQVVLKRPEPAETQNKPAEETIIPKKTGIKTKKAPVVQQSPVPEIKQFDFQEKPINIQLTDITVYSAKQTESLFNAISRDTDSVMAETRRVTESELETYITSQKTDRLGLSLQSNLLYDIVLTPNIGIEATFSETFGFLLNGMWTHINWDNGNKTYRIWTLNPEFRYYLGTDKHFYAGGMFTVGELNFKLNETGRQGNFIGGGLTFGYLKKLTEKLKLDFGIAVGYINFKYDRYNYVEEINIKTDTDTKNYLGPVKAGISLIWKIK